MTNPPPSSADASRPPLQPPDEAGTVRMPLGGHLEELRRRLFLGLLGLAMAFAVSLGVGKGFARLILSPYEDAMRSAGIAAGLQAIQPAEPFAVYMKASFVLALLISSPWLFYQLWAFVSAGLHAQERRFVYLAAPASALLFVAGVLFLLLGIAPWVFQFFMRFDLGLDYLTYQPGLDATVAFILWLALAFGLAFQTPIAIVFAERIGLISIAELRRVRKYVFLAAFFVGAVFTPPDVLSQIALALPLYILFEAGLAVCRFRRRKRNGAEAPP